MPTGPIRGLATTVRRLATTVVLVAALAPVAPALADPAPPPPADPVPPVTAALPVADPALPPAADPPPAPPAELIPGQSGIKNALAQTGSQPGLFGLPDLSAYGPNMLLGQATIPTEPGSPAAAVVPNLSAFNPEYLLGQNTAPAPPGEGTLGPGLAPNEDIPGTGRISFLRRIFEMYQAGGLTGSLLGQQSPEEFVQQAAEAAEAAGAAEAPQQPG